MSNLTDLYRMSELVYVASTADTKWKDFFGIELEVEACNQRDPFDMWTVHNDGSLRDGTEFVLAKPLGGNSLDKAINNFYARGMNYTSGPRTSTHIHVNMRDASIDNLRSMTMMIYFLEDAIFNSVGESRKWSGYSVGLNEMELHRLKSIMSSNDMKVLYGAISPTRNQERYYGFNTAAFRKHGTVEFRYFPGGPSKRELETWVDLVSAIKTIGMKYSPEQLILQIADEESLLRFLDNNFSPYWVQEFTRHDTMASLMDKFNTICALSNDPDELVRRDDIVFINGTFLSFVIKNVLKEEGCKYILPVAHKLGVTSLGEWGYYLEEALQRDISSRRKSKASREVDDNGDGFDVFEPRENMDVDERAPVVEEARPDPRYRELFDAAYAGILDQPLRQAQGQPVRIAPPRANPPPRGQWDDGPYPDPIDRLREIERARQAARAHPRPPVRTRRV
jgi:hypothetical protein